MVASNFDLSLKHLLRDEGGNDDDPNDHGGRTSRGVTQREYDAWCVEKRKPMRDVWNAPDEDIRQIYHDEYWNPLCDALPSGIDYLYFNMAVNAGPHRAAVLLQQALGVVDDGRIGPITRAAIGTTSARTLIIRYTRASDSFYKGLHQPRFIKGWLARNQRVQADALAMLV